MRRIELIKICLHRIVDNCDSRDVYKLLFYLQDINFTYGYAVATLQAFEDSEIGICTDQEISVIMRNGDYDSLFEKWLSEEV